MLSLSLGLPFLFVRFFPTLHSTMSVLLFYLIESSVKDGFSEHVQGYGRASSPKMTINTAILDSFGFMSKMHASFLLHTIIKI